MRGEWRTESTKEPTPAINELTYVGANALSSPQSIPQIKPLQKLCQNDSHLWVLKGGDSAPHQRSTLNQQEPALPVMKWKIGSPHNGIWVTQQTLVFIGKAGASLNFHNLNRSYNTIS